MKEPSDKTSLKPTTIETDIPMDTAESCRRKYNSLKEAQKLHKLNDINYRLEILNKLLYLWDKYSEEVSLSNYLDLGITESGNTISNYCIVKSEIIHAINNLKNWVKPRYVDVPLFLSTSNCYVKPEPYGLVLIFSAWNCNFLTLLIPLIQAISAGNCVIAKPASTAKETCKVCLKILNELPHDVVYGCAGKPEVYTELLNQKWDLIIFTGSAAKGKIIAQAAAPNLTPTILELGGQNPVIVEKSADLKLAAYNIVYGRHMFTGQACIAPEYIMVDKTIKDKLIIELKKTFETFYTKNPENSPELGIMVNNNYAERIKGLIENPGTGAKLLYGDISKINLEKRFIPPFLFEFDKPLSGYLFTKDNNIKEYVRDNTTSGCLDINDTLVHFSSPYLPFGGVGNSGMSSYHGKWGFDNMSHLKPIVDQSSLLLSFRYPPYSKSALKLLKFVIPFKYNRNQLIKFFMYLILLILFLIFILPRFIYKN